MQSCESQLQWIKAHIHNFSSEEEYYIALKEKKNMTKPSLKLILPAFQVAGPQYRDIRIGNAWTLQRKRKEEVIFQRKANQVKFLQFSFFFHKGLQVVITQQLELH